MIYLFYFFGALVLAAALTPAVRKLAWKLECIDIPRPPRNLHPKPIAKLGGLAVFLAVLAMVALYVHSGAVNYQIVPLRFIVAMLAGGAVLMVGGILDDKYDLPPYVLWLPPAIAALIVVASGIGVGITFISNPFGAPFSLKFLVLGLPASAIFVWVWMMGMMFTTKFLDGLDGLVSGIGLIASISLFFLSLGPQVNQPITATFAIIFAGALAGYLVYAFYPASIFLGEGGSTFIGFMLGVLSIILGAKITTALLVMGIPILDVAWVLSRRLLYARSPFRGDRLHLHFRLMDLGFSHRATVLALYLISALFGFTAVFLQSLGKLIALVILFIVMIGIAVSVVALYKRKHPHIPGRPD
jgi:UDP-GlcNAc:undecaprenyl-phosphate/decaprenyl-phosphate GlcNAc-1-phosphate transferase